MERDAEGQVRLAEEVLDGVGDVAQELGIRLGDAVHGPGPRIGVARQAGDGPAVVVERSEAALEAVVEYADERIVAKADCLVAQLAHDLSQMRPAAADAVRRLGDAVGGWVEAGEERRVAGNRPLRRRDGLLEQRPAGGEAVNVGANRPRVTVAAQPVGPLCVQNN